jgi:putative peptide zinc metalloprotease protein
MNAPAALTSPDWRRVAHIKPRLRASATVRRQTHRGEVWHQITDANTGRRHRMNAAAYRFAGLLDGQRTTDDAWRAVLAAFGEAALTQHDALQLLGQLNRAGVLQCEMTPDLERLFAAARRERRRRRFADLNPLAIKVRLFNPQRLLARLDPWLPVLLSPWTLALWLLVVLGAIAAAAPWWPQLWAHGAAHVTSTRYVLLAWLLYPLIKALHEMAHALMVRRFGGTVTEAGFTLMVLAPVPYVDASAASAFPRASQRALVSAAGIAVELFIAALALFVWINTEAGWLHDIAFVTMVVGTVSTLLINGNPLLRFDGYHMLCDALDLPNLDARSRAWWSGLMQRRALGLRAQASPLGDGELKWLVAYAPLALAWRLYLGLLIAAWIAAYSLPLGALAAAGVVIALIVMPLARLAKAADEWPAEHERRRALRLFWGGRRAAVGGVADRAAAAYRGGAGRGMAAGTRAVARRGRWFCARIARARWRCNGGGGDADPAR